MPQGESGRALIVGGDSLVGSALQAHCRKAGIAADLTSRRPGVGGIPLDLSDPDFAPLERAEYRVAFLCAAVTSVPVGPSAAGT